MDHFSPMIAAEVTSTGILTVYSPWDQTPVGTVDCIGPEAMEAALEIAYRRFRDRDTWLSAEDRISVLDKTATLMKEQAETLALEAAREGGKPLMDSRVEVSRAIDSIRLCTEVLRGASDQSTRLDINAASQGRQSWSQAEPMGVVVAISAFNHPLNLIAHQIGPAIAAGCPVIVKPAEDTPLSCFRLVSLLRQAGLPEGWCQAVVTDSLETANRLVRDPRVGFLSFIGSAKVGWMLRSQLAAGTRCALEHGGTAPVIVAEDADFDLTVPKLLKGGFYHAGQVCVSVQRIYVHRSRAREFAERLAVGARALQVGDPTDEMTEVGPLIRSAEVLRVAEWVDEAIEMGAECLCGGDALSKVSYACTVLLDPPDAARVSSLEVFGPVVCVYTYDTLDEAINRANALPWAFQAAVFSQRLDTIRRACDRLDASTVMVNDHTAFRVDWMPFSGLRQSGLGVGGIPYTFQDMRINKMVVLSP